MYTEEANMYREENCMYKRGSGNRRSDVEVSKNQQTRRQKE